MRPRGSRNRWKERDEKRLLEVAARRLAGEEWKQIAASMGWKSKQAAQQWARLALERRP